MATVTSTPMTALSIGATITYARICTTYRTYDERCAAALDAVKHGAITEEDYNELEAMFALGE
jgi:hypothetical protein